MERKKKDNKNKIVIKKINNNNNNVNATLKTFLWIYKYQNVIFMVLFQHRKNELEIEIYNKMFL